MPRKMKRPSERLILISGGYGNGNAGDEALLLSILHDFREVFPEAKYIVLSDDPTYSKARSTETFLYSGGRGLLEKNKPTYQKLCWVIKLARAIAKSDLVITGGGTILQDSTHPMFVPFWLVKIAWAQLLGIPTVMYGIGVGPLRTSFGIFVSRLIVNRMDVITVRGSCSMEVLRSTHIERPRTYITADPAINLTPTTPERALEILTAEGFVRSGKVLVGFAIRQWYFSHVKKLMRPPEWDLAGHTKYRHMIETFAKAADRLVEQYDADVIFIPMSIVTMRDDRRAAHDVISSMKYRDRSFSLKGDYDPREIKALFGQLDLLIGMRLHSLILTAPTKIPIIGVAYGEKTIDFMDSLGMEEFVVNVDTMTAEDLIKLTQKIFDNLDVLLYRISRRVERLQANAKWSARLTADLLFRGVGE
jgi:polysaccharide pyruvyl transferase WcaK-like protein